MCLQLTELYYQGSRNIRRASSWAVNKDEFNHKTNRFDLQAIRSGGNWLHYQLCFSNCISHDSSSLERYIRLLRILASYISIQWDSSSKWKQPKEGLKIFTRAFGFKPFYFSWTEKLTSLRWNWIGAIWKSLEENSRFNLKTTLPFCMESVFAARCSPPRASPCLTFFHRTQVKLNNVTRYYAIDLKIICNYHPWN